MKQTKAITQGARRRGTVAVIVALLLTILMTVVAFSLDGGLALEDRRRVQAAADAAALAAANDLYINFPVYNGLDTPGSAAKAAQALALANGYKDGDGDDTVTVNIPPLGGKFIGQSGYVEVIITYNQPRFFSAVIGSGPIPVKARAVARGLWAPVNDGIIVLHPSLSGALEANGNGDVYVQNSSIIVNSNDSTAAVTVGSAFIADPSKPTWITGKNPGYSGTIKDTIYTGVPPTPDPLAYLPAPDPSTMSIQNAPNGQNGVVNLQPGVYNKGLSFSGSTSVNMAPGIYYMKNGSFSFSGQGNLNATGVMIYSEDGLSVTGLGSVTWSPPTTGIYKGISYFQDRTSTYTAKVAGDGLYNVTGTVYVPAGLTDLQGNGDASIASQVITWTMKAGGNGQTNIVWAGPPVAPIRQLQLVE
jgi:hypothetical protein